MKTGIRLCWMAGALMAPLSLVAQPSVVEPYDIFGCAAMIESRWNSLNLIRTVCSILTFGGLIVSCFFWGE